MRVPAHLTALIGTLVFVAACTAPSATLVSGLPNGAMLTLPRGWQMVDIATDPLALNNPLNVGPEVLDAKVFSPDPNELAASSIVLDGSAPYGFLHVREFTQEQIAETSIRDLRNGVFPFDKTRAKDPAVLKVIAQTPISDQRGFGEHLTFSVRLPSTAHERRRLDVRDDRPDRHHVAGDEPRVCPLRRVYVRLFRGLPVADRWDRELMANDDLIVKPPPMERPSRPKESERTTRKPLAWWDRVKLLLLFATVWVALVLGAYFRLIGGMSRYDALYYAVRMYPALLVLFGLELDPADPLPDRRALEAVLRVLEPDLGPG